MRGRIVKGQGLIFPQGFIWETVSYRGKAMKQESENTVLILILTHVMWANPISFLGFIFFPTNKK